MLVVEKYLKDLVENNRRVIIPTLGAFLLKESKRGGRTVIFSSFLKYNDGFLENAIAGKAGISKERALTAVKKFITTVERSLSSKNTYHISDFGYFTTDSKGAISFISTTPSLQQQVEQIATEFIDEDDIVLEQEPIDIGTDNTVETILTEKVVAHTEKSEDETEDLVVDEEATVSESNEDDKEKIQEPTTVIPINYPSNFDGGSTPEAERGKTSAKRNPVFIAELRVKKKRRKKIKKILGFTSLALVICGIAAFFLLYTGIFESNRLWNGSQSTEFNTTTTLKLIENKEGITPNDSKILISPTSISNVVLHYHIIIGCFVEPINAERFVQRCQEQGLPAETLSRIGDLYPVAVNKSTSYEEAIAMRDKYNTTHPDKAWIYRTY